MHRVNENPWTDWLALGCSRCEFLPAGQTHERLADEEAAVGVSERPQRKAPINLKRVRSLETRVSTVGR
jgi:hypothetical protein